MDQNRTKCANFWGSPLFPSYIQHKNRKAINSLSLYQFDAGMLVEVKGYETDVIKKKKDVMKEYDAINRWHQKKKGGEGGKDREKQEETKLKINSKQELLTGFESPFNSTRSTWDNTTGKMLTVCVFLSCCGFLWLARHLVGLERCGTAGEEWHFVLQAVCVRGLPGPATLVQQPQEAYFHHGYQSGSCQCWMEVWSAAAADTKTLADNRAVCVWTLSHWVSFPWQLLVISSWKASCGSDATQFSENLMVQGLFFEDDNSK